MGKVQVSALVMAGGRATRFDFSNMNIECREKAFLRIGRKYFIESILEALRASTEISRICVSVSPSTPMTKAYLHNKKDAIEVCDTPGNGYHEDLIYAVKTLHLGVVITLGADIPLLRKIHVKHIIQHYWQLKKPALAVMSPVQQFNKWGITPTNSFQIPEYPEPVVPLGINIIDGNLIDLPEIEQSIYILKDEDLLFNVNTVEDYKILTSKYPKGI